jgi:hypothetical protein
MAHAGPSRLPFRALHVPSLPHLPAAARWTLPYAMVWAFILAAISRATHQQDCTAFCAVYAAWQTYGGVLVGVALSAVVAIVQILSVGR